MQEQNLSIKDWNVDIPQQYSNKNLISFVDSKISLFKYLQKYQINFTENYNYSGWTHKSLCPFPDHNEKTPSFSYNSIKDCFYCFGCSRGGRVCHFISYMENTTISKVAQQLYNKYLKEENLEDQQDNANGDYIKITEALLEYADFFSSFIEKHTNDQRAIKYAEDLTFLLDSYVKHHLYNNSIILEHFLARIELLKKYLNEYKNE